MRLVLTALIFIGGLFFTLLAADFLIRPEVAAGGLGISATDTSGVATIRADMTAFFAITGLAMLYGAWKRRRDVLMIPAFMLTTAFVGRAITLATHGGEEGFFVPMIVEAVFAIACIAAIRLLPERAANRS
ncbi:MAG: DUF4345 family protein [Pontixanthobacter sp.]